MKVIKVIWGLLVDDGRLATTLIVALIIAFGLSKANQPLLAGIIIWLGLIVSLWYSIEHQLQLKLKSKK